MAAPKQSDPQFKLRLHKSLKEKLDLASEHNGRSLNSEILTRLEASFHEPLVLTPILRSRIKIASDKSGRTVSTEVAHRLKQSLQADGLGEGLTDQSINLEGTQELEEAFAEAILSAVRAVIRDKRLGRPELDDGEGK